MKPNTGFYIGCTANVILSVFQAPQDINKIPFHKIKKRRNRSQLCFSALVSVGTTRFELATPSTPY